jgi:hypothetical protein
MTLNKHRIDGLPEIFAKVLPADVFEKMMTQAGYSVSGSADAQAGRKKIWWVHSTYRRVEAIYSPDKTVVITAYHPNA